MSESPRTDEEIEQSIVTLFATEGTPSPANLTIHVLNGLVRLGGVATDEGQHQLVLELIRGVPGVRRILDEMVCMPSTSVK